MINLKQARAEVERVQRSVWHQLASALPEPAPDSYDEDFYEKYLKTNPDNVNNDIPSLVKKWKQDRQSQNRDDISALDKSTTSLILINRVDDLKFACGKLQPSRKFDNICFGTIPGGGLDAFTIKVQGVDQYGIIIPNGLFNLINLFCKLVILLQPFRLTMQNPIYPPSASFTQFGLASHPYIAFRKRDLLRAYLLRGDPAAALPYLTALPFQDRFAYLLVGTELFVVAHEAAHVLLGHLKHEDHVELTPDLELEADALALDIVAEYFNNRIDYAYARATLCAFMFLSVNNAWEQTLHHALGAEDQELKVVTHPASQERLQHFVSQLQDPSKASTPPWYIFVHNAIRIATEDWADSIFPEANSIYGFSARVLPIAQAYMGHYRPVPNNQWWTTIAELLISGQPASRRLGLWFLLQFAPQSAIGIYDGLSNDDEVIQDLYKRALISIEPMYEDYLPRLMQRFRETAQEDQDFQYKLNIAMYLIANAGHELGEELEQGNPMSEGFFD